MLTNKTVLITGVGAENGLGFAMAKQMAEAGAKVFIADMKSNVHELAQMIGATAIECCITDDDICAQLDAVIGEGGVDVLVNNAGITRDKSYKKMTEDMFDSVIAVNLRAPWVLTQHFAQKMAERGFGRVVNISSIVGSSGNFGQTNYCATKAGIVGMSKSFAKEVGPKGVTVNCVAPGFILTDMTAAMPVEVLSAQKDQIPVGRLGQPEDIAQAVMFLVTQSGFVNGETIHVNGGQYMN